MAARKKSPADAGAPPSFEDALNELEAIVQAMEEEQLPLEELVSRYEKGMQLLNRCQTVLGSARARLETISKQSATANPLTGDDSEDTDISDDENDDDIRLF